MFLIYRTINTIYVDILKCYDFVLIKSIKSNIHPSILYRSHKNNCEIQIGYNYEDDVPFAFFYGKNIDIPAFNCIDTNSSPSSKLRLYSKTIKDILQIYFQNI